LSAQLRETDQVAVAFFGEGATNEGAFHEAMNLAAVWSLPMVFMCENNGYGQMTRMAKVTSVDEIVSRAASYDMPAQRIDGNDAIAVHAAATEAVARARAGDGPTLVEAITYRWREHAEGLEILFPKFRDRDEIDAWKQRDAIAHHREVLLAAGVAQ